ncbi:MAG TPA: hypothetical protein VFM58_05000 [Solirubrobacteraceae bacterium]|nr:hypothetical protein [Solirubrobacteraceae bacterium]
MSTPAKLALFVGVLAAVFGGAALAGAAIGPDRDADDLASAPHGEMAAEPHGGAADPVRGLAIADDGLRIVVEDPELARGREQALRFRIVDERGATVRDFDVEHERRMHLILARRDLTGFQHLHPEQAADGSWSTPVRLAAAGSYRLFADFAHDGEAQTLASDLRVDGAADLEALPAPAATAVSDGGYDVRLDARDAGPGEEADLRFTIMRDGRPVRTEPYLGAGGHLVALREGDLAFLHVHPLAEDSVRFAATFPTAGRYRLFLQFRHAGRIQTAAFTYEVGR